MRRIRLSNTGRYALVDDSDYPALSMFHWTEKVSRHTSYAIRTVYLPDTQKCRIVRMHRQIMNPADDQQIDHRNRNGLDNRRSNLRFATPTQNIANSRRRKNNTSGFPGVHFCHKTKRWRARIDHAGKTIHIGRFDSAKTAGAAYRKLHKAIHGEFSS